jgi:hypothetical protein
MKYSDFNTELPKLQLGQVVGQSNNTVDEGVGRTIRLGLDEIEVDEEGFAQNVKLSGNRQYIVKTGFVPDSTGLGSINAK